MGKKRTHAETKDGFTKPPPDKGRVVAHQDKKDKRKNGEEKRPKAALVCHRIRVILGLVANALLSSSLPSPNGTR